MNRQIRRIDPSTVIAGAAIEDYTPRAAAAEWVLIEDDGLPEPEPEARRTIDRRLALIVAVMGAVVGFGFAGGHDSGAAVEPPIVLDSPAEGATIEGTTVDFAGVVRSVPGTVEVTVRLGGVVIGGTSISAGPDGTISGSIPVFAPPATVEVELVARSTDATGDEAVSRRALTLRPSGPLGLWPVQIERANGRTSVTVSGSAPSSAARVTVRVSARAGQPVATAAVDVTSSGPVVGSAGAASLGLGSFTARVPLPDPLPAGPLRIEVAWRDDVNGSWGSTWLSIPGRAGDPRRVN